MSGLLYYLVGLTAPEGGLKQSEVVPEPRLMGTSADDVRKHRSDIEKYLEYLTLLTPFGKEPTACSRIMRLCCVSVQI